MSDKDNVKSELKEDSQKNLKKDFVRDRFEFRLKYNNRVVCQRYFRILGYKRESLGSMELYDAMNECAEIIKSDLQEKTDIFLYTAAPHIFKNKEEMDEKLPVLGEDFTAPAYILLKDTGEFFKWNGIEAKPTEPRFNTEDFINGLDDPKDAMFEFEFLMDGRKVSSILIDGSIYPRFVRKNIDLTNSKNRYRSENVYAPLECYIVDQFRTECSDVTRELIDVLCSCCCHDDPESYHTKTTFGGMSTPVDIFVEHQDFRYIKKLEAILTWKTRRYMKELYY